MLFRSHPDPVSFSFPTILEMPAPLLLGYTQESVVAEKVDAMLQLGELNSRMKDFYDIWYLSHQIPFKSKSLVTALKITFNKRGTLLPSDPIVFQEGFEKNRLKLEQWTHFYQQNRLPDIPSFSTVISRLKTLLVPVLHSIRSGQSIDGIWSPIHTRWLLNSEDSAP